MMVFTGHEPGGGGAAPLFRPRCFLMLALAGCVWAGVSLGGSPSAGAAEPAAAEPGGPPLALRLQIDEALKRTAAGGPAGSCTDEVFIRRASLDFRGFTPKADEVRAFAADASPDKRARLVDAFIADPQHQRHLTNVLDVMLMERRAETHVKTGEWRAWLRQQVAARAPWDQLVRALLVADGADEAARGAARWLLGREAEPNALARDTSRIFLGMDLSCAQCHDHPRVADYWQRDYQGLLAFFNRTYLFQPEPEKPALVGERADGETSFVSVFTKLGGQARPRLPGDDVEIVEPPADPASPWLVAPDEKDKNVRPVPRHSRRAMLADSLTTSRAFALNAANRLWASLMGRGIVEPVDLRHSANPHAADAVLDLLADGLVALRYDISAYWRELALSHAYQAPYDAPSPAAAPATPLADTDALKAAAEAAEAAATAERETRHRENDARKAWEPLQLAAQALDSELAAAAKTVAEARPPAETAHAAMETARVELAAKAEFLTVLEAAATQCARAAAIVAEAPELARAAALLENRLAAARSEHESLVKNAAAKESDYESKAAALATAEENVAALAPRQAEAQKAAATAWQAVADAAEAARESRATARRLARDADRARALADIATAARHLAETRRQLDAAEQAAQAVAGAATAAQTASTRLPDDQELAAVVAQVQARHAATADAVQADRRVAEEAATAFAAASESMVAHWTNSFALASLTPLSPEQLCWSLLRATGTLDQLRAQAAREWDEKNPVPSGPDADAGPEPAPATADAAIATADPAHIAARAAGIDALLEEKVRPHEDQFVRLFGNGAGSPQTDFFATSDQALYFENAGALRSWTRPGGGNLAERLVAIDDPAGLTHELYLAVLSRPPSAEETAGITQLFAARPDDQKPAALSDALWALLTSAEFRFKH